MSPWVHWASLVRARRHIKRLATDSGGAQSRSWVIHPRNPSTGHYAATPQPMWMLNPVRRASSRPERCQAARIVRPPLLTGRGKRTPFEADFFRRPRTRSAAFPHPRKAPPHTSRVAPVMYPASGEARKPTAAATSSGSARRPSGIPAMIRSLSTDGNASSLASIRAVRVTPGATQFTVTPAVANSNAADRVMLITAAFAAA